MNLLGNPELLNRLAAAHALGTLRGGARRRFEAMARDQAPVRAAAIVWQSRLSGMTELQAPVVPSAAVWTRIDNLIRADLEAAAMAAARQTPPARGAWHSLLFWRGATAAGALAAALAVGVGLNLHRSLGQEQSQVAALQSQLAATPRVEYVAVLADDRSAATVLVTFDARTRRMVLQRVGDYREATDKSLQLWALPPAGSGGAPRSLGVLSEDKVLRLVASDLQSREVREAPALAISLEPKGGVPGDRGPTGPVLFKGAVLQTTL